MKTHWTIYVVQFIRAPVRMLYDEWRNGETEMCVCVCVCIRKKKNFSRGHRTIATFSTLDWESIYILNYFFRPIFAIV